MSSASQWLNAAIVARAPAQPDLREQLIATRRELVATRRAPLARQAARRQPGPVSSYDTTRALSVVLQHSANGALEELRAERDRLPRDLATSETRRRTAESKYSTMRYNVWRLVQQAQLGEELPDDIMDRILEETSDSDDDRRWDEGDWVQ